MKSTTTEPTSEQRVLPWSDLTDVQQTIVQTLEEDPEGLVSQQELIDACDPSETTVRKHLFELEDEGVLKKREYGANVWMFDEETRVEARFTSRLRKLLPTKWSSTADAARGIRLELGLAAFGGILWMLGPVLVVLPITLLALEAPLPVGTLEHWLLVGWAVPAIGFVCMIPAAVGIALEILQLGLREYRRL